MHMPRHMFRRPRHLAVSLLTISLLAATLTMADSLASPGRAEARCNGINNPIRSTFSYDGAVVASETPETDTCNGNGLYTGILKDERADGYCVEVQFKETGIDWTPAGDVCGYGNTASFHWSDLNGNSYAYERFCIWPVDNPAVTTACGWGTGPGYGVNQGY